MNKSKIEWCDLTWNPVTGCLHSCRHSFCYAAKIAQRFGGYTDNEYIAKHPEVEKTIIHELYTFLINDIPKPRKAPYPFFFDPTFHRYRLDEPEKRAKAAKIFVCSMADLFGDWVPDAWILNVFAACKAAPQHQYIFLTKNPHRYEVLEQAGILPALPNFWYGNTITSQADACMPDIVAQRFLSIEPILGPVSLRDMRRSPAFWGKVMSTMRAWPDWVIIGAETGNRKEKVAPDPNWIRTLVWECDQQAVPVFLKDSLAAVFEKPKEQLRAEYPQGLQTGGPSC